MITLTPAEKLIAAQSYLDDMNRLVRESADQKNSRVWFFGEDCDKNKVLNTLAAKITAVLN